MLRRLAIALAAASLLGAASIPTSALAFGRGVGGHGGFGGAGFGHGGSGGFARGFGGGVAHSFAAPRMVGAPHVFSGHGFAGRSFVGHGFAPRFHGRHFARFGVPFGLGLGLGYGAYSYYGDRCYAWTPYGYTWVCGYDY